MKKRCCTCKELKNTNEFYKNSSTGDGLQILCKKCLSRAVSKSSKKTRKERARSMRCRDCGCELMKGVKGVLCVSCKEKRKERHAKKYYSSLEKGLCGTCGKGKLKNKSMCEDCYNRSRDWYTGDSVRRVYDAAKQSSRKRGYEFNIEKSDIVIPNVCPLLGIPLHHGEGIKCDNSPSVDRIDSSKGYIKGNVWVISEKANRMKTDATPEEIMIFSKNVKKILIKR
jgi:hypothetical protein